MPKRFPPKILNALDKEKIMGLRAGRKPHRFIGIWMVVVEGRVFVRSYFQKQRSWYRAFLEDPHGKIQVARRSIPVHAIHTRSERLKKAVDRAYLQKHNTPGSLKFSRGFSNGKRRNTTMELVPW